MKKVLAYIVAFSTMISGFVIAQKGCNEVKDIVKRSSLSQDINNLIGKVKDKFKNKDNEVIEETIKQNETTNSYEETVELTTNSVTEEDIIPTTIEETIPEETIPEETIPEETEYQYSDVEISSFATVDLPLYDEYGNIVCMVEKYEKVIITDLTNYFNRLVKCKLSDDTVGYIDFTMLELLPETYAEVDISEQKVYCYYQGELVLVADCVTGIPTYGTTKGTNKGYTEINGKLYNSKLMGNAPSKIFISFNSDGEGFHDARWRNQFGGDIYLTNGSHGCVNMRLEDVLVLDKYLDKGNKVLVHK